MQQGSETLNLEQALGILRRRVALIVLCVAVVAGAAYAYSKHQAKQYTATASLAFSNNQLSQQIAGLPAVSTGNPLVQQASNVALVKLGDMATKTASLLGHGLTASKVYKGLSVSGQGESSVVEISSTAASPALAAGIANTYARQFVVEQQGASHRYFKSALALVHKQLATLSPRQRVGVDGLELQNRAQTLGLLAELQYGNVQVAQEAPIPFSPSSPKVSRNTILGGLVGLLIGLGLALLLERLDRRVRSPEDLEAIYRLPTLGAVPKSSALLGTALHTGGTLAVLPPEEAEAFNLIRAHLRFFNVNRELRTIMITSAASGDGKTTIASHLAGAAASMGSRVLLVEADLRHPSFARQLGIQSGPGLAEMLIGAISMDEAIHSIRLEARADEEAGRARMLDVLAASAVSAPNPGELIESHAMRVLLQRVHSTYDLVVIDAPPLTTVSDAFSLLRQVDGVVVVGWIGRSRRDLAERLHQILDSRQAPLLGVIANGSKSGGSGSGIYTKGEMAPPVVASENGSSASQEFVPTARV